MFGRRRAVANPNEFAVAEKKVAPVRLGPEIKYEVPQLQSQAGQTKIASDVEGLHGLEMLLVRVLSFSPLVEQGYDYRHFGYDTAAMHKYEDRTTPAKVTVVYKDGHRVNYTLTSRTDHRHEIVSD